MAQITLDDVTKRYDDGFEAVKHLNLEIADGEFLCSSGRRAAASRRRCG